MSDTVTSYYIDAVTIFSESTIIDLSISDSSMVKTRFSESLNERGGRVVVEHFKFTVDLSNVMRCKILEQTGFGQEKITFTFKTTLTVDPKTEEATCTCDDLTVEKILNWEGKEKRFSLGDVFYLCNRMKFVYYNYLTFESTPVN